MMNVTNNTNNMINNIENEIIKPKKYEILSPTNDYVFKRVFGKVGNEDITKDLIEKIVGEKYKSIDLSKNTIILPEDIKGKTAILDVRAEAVTEDENNQTVDIEMQVVEYNYMPKRMLFYWSKAFNDMIERGGRYSSLKKTICILFTSFDARELPNLSEVEEMHSKYTLLNNKRPNVQLTDLIEFHIINLKVLENDKENNLGLNSWCQFLNSPDKLGDDYMSDVIKKAKEELDNMSKNEMERISALEREMALYDQNSIREDGYLEGKEIGKKEGIKEGIREGMEKGKEETNIENAKRMIKEGIQDDVISRITELTIDEIKKLKK